MLSELLLGTKLEIWLKLCVCVCLCDMHYYMKDILYCRFYIGYSKPDVVNCVVAFLQLNVTSQHQLFINWCRKNVSNIDKNLNQC